MGIHKIEMFDFQNIDSSPVQHNTHIIQSVPELVWHNLVANTTSKKMTKT